MAIEIPISGEVFAKDESNYDADPGGKWQAGISRKATVLDFNTREIHVIRFRGADGQMAFARLAVDEHVDLVVRVNASTNRVVLDFAGYQTSATEPKAVKAS